MKSMLVAATMLSIAACASRGPTDADRLAMILAHAGEPVQKIRNHDAMGWNRVDDEHVLLDMRPGETWLMRLSGPCLDWGSGAQVLGLSSQGPYVMAKLDRILVSGSPISCRIEEIRPVNTKPLRAAEAAMRDQAAVSR